MRSAGPTPSHRDTGDLRGLGSRIVELRSSRGWKQVELGRRTGIAPPRLSRIENGRAAPNLAELIRLRNALGTGLEEIVFGEESAAAGTLRQLAAELDPQGAPHDLNVLERLLHYLVVGYQAEHKERAAC